MRGILFMINWSVSHELSVLIFFPLIWAILGLILFVPFKSVRNLKFWSLLGSVLTLALAMWIFVHYSEDGPIFQYTQDESWIRSFGIHYAIGIDGISLELILLTTFFMPLVILFSLNTIQIRCYEYYFLLLALETGLIGTFAACDIFLFYFFWEIMLIPMYFLIGIWGGTERIYASMKFFLYTLLGSLLMWIAILYLMHEHKVQFGFYSTLITHLYQLSLTGGSGFLNIQNLLFLAFTFAFAIKTPLFPFHTWLPDAHVQAPTGGSVLLAAVLLKMGGYGLIRFVLPLFPDSVHYFQEMMMGLASLAILYGACVAWVQTDIKKLVAYSSVSHMGYVVLGCFSSHEIGITGSIYQMLSHGISTGGLFFLVGILYERRHTRELAALNGIMQTMPLFGSFFMLILLSSIALPGTNGFIGEFLILLGSWQSQPILTAISTFGIILSAAYMLRLFQNVMDGPVQTPENQTLSDVSFKEILILFPIVIVIFWMGIFPNFFLRKLEPSVQFLMSQTLKSATVHTPSKGI